MALPTDLEALVQHLAGRASAAARSARDPADSLASRLDDPTSDARIFLDEILRKTRALLDDPADADPQPGPAATTPRAAPTPGRDGGATASRGRNPALWAALLLGAILGGGLSGVVARTLDRAGARRAGERDDRMVAAIRREVAALGGGAAPPAGDPGVIRAGLDQLADRLDRLDRGFAALARGDEERRPVAGGPAPAPASSPAPDPQIAAVTADLAAIRRELGLSEAATSRQIQEMRTVLQEVNTVVRRVLSRPQVDNIAAITGPLIDVAVQALTNNLQHPSPQVRGEAVEQLMRLGPPARSALPALQQRLNQESDSNVRATIQAALGVLSAG